MGQANSTVITSKDVLESINSVTMKNLQSCSNNLNFTQSFVVSGDGNVIQDVLLDQESNVDFQCFGDTTNQVNLLNDLSNSISQKAKSKAAFLLGFAFNSSVTTNNSVLRSVQTSMVQNIQKCSVDGNITQEFDISGSYNSIVDVTMKQNPNYFCKCVFGSDNVTEVAAKLSNEVNQEAAAEGGGLGNLVTLIIVAALIILGLVAVGYFVKLMRDQQKNSDKELPGVAALLGLSVGKQQQKQASKSQSTNNNDKPSIPNKPLPAAPTSASKQSDEKETIE
jgi:hypothetical protein